MIRIAFLIALVTLPLNAPCRADHQPGHQPGGGGGGGGNNASDNGGGVIYFSYEGRPYTMNDDGSSVTLLDNFPPSYYANFNEEPSRDLHAGKRWFLDGDGLAILSDAGDIVPLDLPSDISHSNPRWGVGDGFLSWVGQRWDDDATSSTYGSVVEGGLYTIDVDFDQQGNIQGTVGSPQLLVSFPLVDCPAGTPCADVVAPDIQSHDWAPDGNKFVYDTLVDRELRTYDLDTGSEATILSDGESWSPRWSPAGDQIMFSHYARRRAGIMVVGVDGSDMTQIQTDNNSQHPRVGAWSPTGSHLIYLSDDVFNLDSHIVRATSGGKHKTLLTDERFETGFNALWPLGWREAPAAEGVAVPEPGSALLCLGLITCLVAGQRRFHRLRGLAAVMLVAALLPVSAVRAAEFIPLGFPPGADSSTVHGMSPDESFVVGSYNSVFPRGFRWSEAGGFEPLGNLPPGYTFDEAQDASMHAEVVVGTLYGASDAREAFRWTPSEGIRGLGVLPGMAISWNAQVSADGSVVIGTSSNGAESARAFRWTEATGMQDLGVLPAGNLSFGYGVAADGSVVVGVNFADSSGTKFDAYRWTEATGMQALPPLPGDNSSSAVGISSDGQVVVGDSVLFDGGTLVSRRAVRWTADGIPEELGSLSADDTTYATSASADGSVILGSSNQFGAFIWTELQGMQSLEDVFLQNGIQPTGWRRLGTGVISDDGLTIAGWGFNADNVREGWVAHLDVVPEPSALVLLLGGLFGMLRTKRGIVLASGLLLATSIAVGPGHAAEFIPLGFPPGENISLVQGMSPDGSIVVGEYGSSFPEAFRWSEVAGFESLGQLPAGYTFNHATDASVHGEVVVGTFWLFPLSGLATHHSESAEADAARSTIFAPSQRASSVLEMSVSATTEVDRPMRVRRYPTAPKLDHPTRVRFDANLLR